MKKRPLKSKTINSTLVIIVMVIASSSAMAFTDTIDTSLPAGGDDPREADDNMRRIQGGFQELGNVEHDYSLTGTEITGDGYHRRRVNVVAKGADVTGVSSSSTAFASAVTEALADNKSVFIPKGSYLLDATWLQKSVNIIGDDTKPTLNFSGVDVGIQIGHATAVAAQSSGWKLKNLTVNMSLANNNAVGIKSIAGFAAAEIENVTVNTSTATGITGIQITSLSGDVAGNNIIREVSMAASGSGTLTSGLDMKTLAAVKQNENVIERLKVAINTSGQVLFQIFGDGNLISGGDFFLHITTANQVRVKGNNNTFLNQFFDNAGAVQTAGKPVVLFDDVSSRRRTIFIGCVGMDDVDDMAVATGETVTDDNASHQIANRGVTTNNLRAPYVKSNLLGNGQFDFWNYGTPFVDVGIGNGSTADLWLGNLNSNQYTITRDATNTLFGQFGCAINIDTDNGTGTFSGISQQIDVDGGTTSGTPDTRTGVPIKWLRGKEITLTAIIKGSAANTSWKLTLNDDAVSDSSSQATTLGTDWKVVRVTHTVDSSATFVTAFIGINDPTNSKTLFVDSMTCHVGFARHEDIRPTPWGEGPDAVKSGLMVIGGKKHFYGTAAPTAGTWVVGDITWNTSPSPSGNAGWICTIAGTPGTWKTFGTIGS